jgi:hypothetical protein
LAETTAPAAASSATAGAAKASTAAATAKLLPVTTTIWASVTAAIWSTISTAVASGARAVAWRGTILCGVVAGCEILRRRFVRVRLALFFGFRMRFFNARRIGLRFFDVGVNVVLPGFAVGFFAYEFW